jgi:hypothetical protein
LDEIGGAASFMTRDEFFIPLAGNIDASRERAESKGNRIFKQFLKISKCKLASERFSTRH